MDRSVGRRLIGTVADMEYTFEPVEGGGYVARFDGVLDGASVGEFWTHVLAVRPDGGFTFAVLDVEDTTIPNIETWPGSPETLELLHPIARMATQSLHPRFHLALVSTNGILDNVIEDLTGLVAFGSAGVPKENMAVRRFVDTDEALAWCRSETAD